MEEIRKELKSDKLGIMECYNLGGKIFKNFLVEEKKWVIPMFLILAVMYFSMITEAKFIFVNSRIRLDIVIINFILLRLTAILAGIAYLLFINKIVTKIENKRDFSVSKLIFKTVIASVILLVLQILSEVGKTFFGNIITGIVSIIIHFNTLFFLEKYLTRDIGLIEALEENFKLCKGNRLESIGINIITAIVYMINLVIGVAVENSVVIGIVVIILSVITLYRIIVWAVFYLNCEYDYEDTKKFWEERPDVVE